MDLLSREADQPSGSPRGGLEGDGIELRGRGDGAVAGTSGPAAQRARDACPVGGQRDRLALAGGWRLAGAAVWVPGLADGVDGLFTNDKFCLARHGRLTLSWRRGLRRADRPTDGTGAAVPGGTCPLGVGHEAAVDRGAAPSQRPCGGATVGSSLPAAPVSGHGMSGRARRPDVQLGGAPPCR